MNDFLKDILRTAYLSNGLKITLIEKPDFNSLSAHLIVRAGSVNAINCPPGTAHCLEHLLFHKKDGEIDDYFSSEGLEVNACTSYNNTDFFSHILKKDFNKLPKLFELLMKIVTEPYFTDNLLKKEKLIIASELDLTNDDLEAQIINKLLRTLYPNTLLSYDILGDYNSLQQIDQKYLKMFFDEYYRLDNMELFVCGPIKISEIIIILEKLKISQIKINDQLPKLKYLFNESLPSHTIEKGCLVRFGIGWSLSNSFSSYQEEFSFLVCLECLFGVSSDFYLTSLNNSWISDDFYYELIVEKNFSFIYFSGITDSLDLLSKEIQNTINRLNISENTFKIILKGFVGRFISSFDSIASIESLDSDGKFKLDDFIKSIDKINDLSFQRTKEIFLKIFKNSNFGCVWEKIS